MNYNHEVEITYRGPYSTVRCNDCGWSETCASSKHATERAEYHVSEVAESYRIDQWNNKTRRFIDLSEVILEGIEEVRSTKPQSFPADYISNRIAQANALSNLAIARNTFKGDKYERE